MTDVQLTELIDSTIKWANELCAVWVGTRNENIIKSQRQHLEDLVEDGDMNLASIQVLELAQTCDGIESEK